MSGWRQRAARAALAAPALTGAALLGAAAPAVSGHDGNAPVNFAADRIEVQDRADRVVLAGDVDITQSELRLRAARVTVNYTNADALQVQRMIAGGGVVVTRPGQTARGDVAVYDLNQRIITMAGNVALTRATDTLRGGRLVINLATGIASVDGTSSGGGPAGTTRSGGRVSGQFSVPKRQ